RHQPLTAARDAGYRRGRGAKATAVEGNRRVDLEAVVPQSLRCRSISSARLGTAAATQLGCHRRSTNCYPTAPPSSRGPAAARRSVLANRSAGGRSRSARQAPGTEKQREELDTFRTEAEVIRGRSTKPPPQSTPRQPAEELTLLEETRGPAAKRAYPCVPTPI